MSGISETKIPTLPGIKLDTLTLAEQAQQMFERGQYAELRAFKKAKKKSWAALGLNNEMESRVMDAPINVEGTVTGRLSPSEPEMQEIVSKGGRGSAKRPGALSKRRLLRLANANLKVLRYRPREIHAIMGQASHTLMAHIASIKEQEKFRADPRFPIFQMTQRAKRYRAIFAGPAGKPIFG
jgi:hypothetical protein